MSTNLMRAVNLVVMLGLVALAGVAAAEDPVDVSGDWTLTWQGRQGERTMNATFEQDGETLSGAVMGPQGNQMPLSGSVKGDKIKFTVKFTTQRGEFEMNFKGKVEGDSMKGQIALPNDMTIDWQGAKK
jgi:hypothetical protein